MERRASFIRHFTRNTIELTVWELGMFEIFLNLGWFSSHCPLDSTANSAIDKLSAGGLRNCPAQHGTCCGSDEVVADTPKLGHEASGQASSQEAITKTSSIDAFDNAACHGLKQHPAPDIQSEL